MPLLEVPVQAMKLAVLSHTLAFAAGIAAFVYASYVWFDRRFMARW